MLQGVVTILSGLLQKISALMLILMMLLTCADVVGNMFGYPILGSEEIVALMAALLLAFVLPRAHINRAHIGIDLIYRRLSRRARSINDVFVSLISLIFFVLASWQCFEYAQDLQASGEVSATLQLPFYYILYALSLSTFVLSLAILQDLIQALRRNDNE